MTLLYAPKQQVRCCPTCGTDDPERIFFCPCYPKEYCEGQCERCENAFHDVLPEVKPITINGGNHGAL